MNLEGIGRTYTRHFSGFASDEAGPPPMPAQPVRNPRSAAPPRAKSFFGLRRTPTPPTIVTPEEIPVLEGARAMSTFLSEGEDDDDDDDEDEDADDDGDDDDEGEGSAPGNGNLDNVAVLQTDPNSKTAPSKRSKAKGTLRKLTRLSPKRDTESTAASLRPSIDSPLIFDRKPPTSNSHISDRASVAANMNTHRHMVRSGWLVRQGQHLKTWKRRYFVLIKRTNTLTGQYTASLQYYKGSNFGKLRGEIDLHEGGPLAIRFVDVGESKKPFCFELSRGEFSLYLQGKDDEDVSAWVWHLQTLTVRTPNDMLGRSASEGRLNVQASHASAVLASLPSSIALGSRGIFVMAELRRLLHNSKSPEASKCKTFVKQFECRSTSSLRQVRDLHASVTDSIMRIHGARIIAMSEEKAQIEQQTGRASSSSREPLKLNDLRVATSRHVEDVIYTPLQETISGFLRRAFGEDDVILNRKLRWLQGKDQTYYNIPLHHNSWKEWRKASKLLSHIATVPLPTAKYEVLVATLKEIQLTYAEEHDQVFDNDNQLETDDLIPIFTYVLANSGLDNLLSLKLLLSELNGAWAVGGSLDNGAALNVFQYAVDFIGSVTIPAVLEDIFRDQVTLSIDGEWRQILELEVEPTYRYGAVVRQISPHGVNTIGSSITRGHVLVTVNGQNVVLWPYVSISALLKESSPPHRLAFIPSASYFKILTSAKALWNVALVNACQRGDIASVQMLLANGADVNYVAHECGGNTPLHIAVSALHFNVVSYILQHGAKARTLGEYGRTALHMVGSPCTLPSPSLSAAVTAAASSASMGNSLRHSGTSKFRPQDKVMMIIKKLLSHGTPMDSTDIFGFTPLHLLARKGLVNGIDVIVEFSAGDIDLNSRNWQHGMSALAFAAREGHQEVIDALLDYGVQPDLCNLNGDTALHFAASIGSASICRALIERGCDVDVRNRDGVTPLMIAAGADGFALSEKTAAAAVPTVAGKPGKPKASRTTRSRVESPELCETIDYLIGAGADLYAVCHQYRLPLHYAAMYGTRSVYDHVHSKMGSADDSLRRDVFGRSAVAMLEERREVALHASSSDVRSTDDDENEVRESQMEPQSDFQLLVGTDSRRASEKVERGDNLVIEVPEDDPSQRIVVAGTFDAICEELYQFQNYKLDDVAALINTCTVASYQALIDHLRSLLRKSEETSDKLYVRRMVLHSVDLMVHSFMQKVELDAEVCSCIHSFCTELFPFKVEDDPPCGQWLASSSLLPMFAEAVRLQRLYDLRISTPCEAAYESLRRFLKHAKRANPTLKFLDDDQFASTFGVEVITEAMRRRMSIAGVWQGEATKSFVVRGDSTESPSVNLTRKSLAPSALHRDRSLGNSEKAPRLWLLDVDVSVLAEQITLFQHYLLSQIRVSELLESKRSAEKTPAYDRLRQVHNHISVWVVNQILSRDDVDQRAQILAHFIKVAATCLQPLQNFDGFMAIMNATNDSSVFRLKKTWSRLQPQVRDQWHELKKCTENGARSLHKTMKDAVPPTIPYLGVVMQNIIAVQEFPDRTEAGLINFKKIRLLGAVVKRFTSIQSSPYLLQLDKRVLDQVCATLPYPSADVCFERSLILEPRIATA